MEKTDIVATLLVIILFFCCIEGNANNAVDFDPVGKKNNIDQLSYQENGDTVFVAANIQKIAQEVVRRNLSAVNEYLKTQMSKEQIKAEKGIFEPVLQSSFNKQKIHIPNSVYDKLISQQTEYNEKSDALEVGLGGMIPIGTQWNIKFLGNKKNSSIIDQYANYLYEYNDSLKLSIEQPLLSGFGLDATMVKINLAKAQSDLDESKFDQKLMELVGVTIQLYWKLYGSQKIAQSWEASLKIAEDSLKDIELRATSGKIANTEVMEAKSAVSARKAEALNARSKVVEVQNQLLTLLNVSVSDNKSVQLSLMDDPFKDYITILSTDEYVKIALEKWPEYKAIKIAVEKEKIQLKNAKNQALPKLDFVGSVYTTSLTGDKETSFKGVSDNKFLSWSVGLKLNVPVLGNMQAKSNLSIAEMRTRQAENELSSFVRSLNNSMNSKVDELKSFQEQLREYEKGLAVKDQLLEIERVKFKSGRTNLKNLFIKEEEYINYQRKVFSAVINYKVSEASLEIAMGNILSKYDISRHNIIRKTDDLSKDLRTILN